MSTSTAASWRDKLIPAQYTAWVKSMAYALVLANIVLIISGGIVRLTGSGLGCDTWPKCTSDGSWTTTPEMGIHGIVEFTNRMLTFVLMVVTILAFLSILRLAMPEMRSIKELLPKLFTGLRASEYRYSDLFNLALLLLWGIPLQAVVGGISVHLKLNPWMITAHYYLSAIMIALAACYLNRVLRYFEHGAYTNEALANRQLLQGSGILKALAWLSAALVAFLVFMGTVTTGTGPHAGDPEAHRHAFNPWIVTRMHSFSVWGYCIVIAVLFVLAKKYLWPRTFTKTIGFVFAVLIYQAIIGYLQFFNGLPIWLVEMHLIGSGFFIWASSSLIEKQFVLSSSTSRRRIANRTAIETASYATK